MADVGRPANDPAGYRRLSATLAELTLNSPRRLCQCAARQNSYDELRGRGGTRGLRRPIRCLPRQKNEQRDTRCNTHIGDVKRREPNFVAAPGRPVETEEIDDMPPEDAVEQISDDPAHQTSEGNLAA